MQQQCSWLVCSGGTAVTQHHRLCSVVLVVVVPHSHQPLSVLTTASECGPPPKVETEL